MVPTSLLEKKEVNLLNEKQRCTIYALKDYLTLSTSYKGNTYLVSGRGLGAVHWGSRQIEAVWDQG